MTTPDSKEAPELKACPFCGYSEVQVMYDTAMRRRLTYCGHCGARGPLSDSQDHATETWNIRADLVNREPSEGDVATVVSSVDSSVYGQDFYGILNADGQFWTPLAFDSEGAARAHIAAFWNTPQQVEHFMRRAKIVPVRVQLTAIQAPKETP